MNTQPKQNYTLKIGRMRENVWFMMSVNIDSTFDKVS